jgi:regulator of sigma E protease
MMVGLITGSTSLKQLSGPISIADMAGKSAQFGWQPFLSFLALLSISIGLLNLVPLPMLDGGQLLYDAWEMVSGKRLSIELQGIFQKFGFILIIALTIFAVFNDLQRFFPS